MKKVKNIYQQISAPARKIIIFAYTDPSNLASEAVVEKNDFSKLEQQYRYDGEYNNLWITEV